MKEIWLTLDEARGVVKSRLGSSEGRAAAVMATAHKSGEVRTQEPIFLNEDGVVAMRWKQIGVRRFSEPDLVDWLDRSFPEARARRGRGGRPPAYDWDKIRATTFELMDHHDEFSVDDPQWNAQARLEEILADRFGVGTSALRVHLPKFLGEWRKKKAGN